MVVRVPLKALEVTAARATDHNRPELGEVSFAPAPTSSLNWPIGLKEFSGLTLSSGREACFGISSFCQTGLYLLKQGELPVGTQGTRRKRSRQQRQG